MSILKHKDYDGAVEIDTERMVLRGKILYINDLVTYEANSRLELQKAFEDSVAGYLTTCKNLNRKPQKE